MYAIGDRRSNIIQAAFQNYKKIEIKRKLKKLAKIQKEREEIWHTRLTNTPK